MDAQRAEFHAWLSEKLDESLPELVSRCPGVSRALLRRSLRSRYLEGFGARAAIEYVAADFQPVPESRLPKHLRTI